ncbi:unnamed protein product [Mytilus edulis]|uniref:C2H2-type domain-containing protein n=1 Tax=Mytilus edulis TaxID=6550 RepID=A0A8S3QDE3_MYTED|nr:unnamed protein product [Mytilus edulis]
MADDHFCEDLLRLYPDSNPQYQQQLRELNDRLSVDNDNRSNLTVKVYSCYYCKLLFDHPSKLKRHQRNSCTFPCRQCDRHFDSAENLFKHSNIDHTTYQTGSGNTDSNSHTTIKHKSVDKSALLGIARARFIYPNEDNGEKYDLLAFLSGIKHEVKTHLQEMCDELGHIKWYMNCLVQMIKPNGGEGGNDLKNNAHFISKTSNLVDRANIDDEHDINVTYQKIFKSFDEYIRNGSGWSLDHIKHIEINTAKYKPLGGGSYIPLPRTLAATRALLNIRNLDEKCFVYAIIASIHPTCSGDPSKVHHYIPYEHELNMEGFTSEHTLEKHIKYCSKFEAQHVTYPTKGVDDILTFQDHAKQLQTSFVIYADMETFCEPMVTEEPEDNRTSTTKLTKLIPCGYGYQVVCIDDRYTQPPKIYRGENVSEHFLHSLLDENKRIKAILNNPEPLCMTVEDEEDFQSSTHCHICMEEFTDSTIRVRDHAHVSGTYPYEYIDNAARFNETELPSIDKFYSNLSEKTISQTEYEHAQRVWNQMNIKNIGEYHDLYLKTDVLLLADVFETFRKKWITNYSLDPANYYTLPGLSWQSALKMTGVRLELLTDPTMWLFFEQSIRGGLTMHEHAISCGKFQWLSEEEINDFNVLNVSNNADIGYVIECDLDYPDNLHDLHNDFPLAVEKGVITNEMLSPHSRHLYEQANDDGKEYQPSTKLLATLKDKKHYILHYVNLKLYLKLGLVLKKIHNIVSFEQRPWLKQYIDFNTEMRKKATSNFEQKLLKMATMLFSVNQWNRCGNISTSLSVIGGISFKNLLQNHHLKALRYSTTTCAACYKPKQKFSSTNQFT